MADLNDAEKCFVNFADSVKKGIDKGLVKSGHAISRKAKRKLGRYQKASNGFPAWPVLSDAAVISKLSKNVKLATRFSKRHQEIRATGTNYDSPLVDTGNLRRAITVDEHDAEKNKVYVGTSGIKYASDHEFGNIAHHVPARPFLRPAAYECKDDIEDIVKNSIIDSIRKSFRG